MLKIELLVGAFRIFNLSETLLYNLNIKTSGHKLLSANSLDLGIRPASLISKLLSYFIRLLDCECR